MAISKEQFDSLKSGEIVRISLKACMGGLMDKVLYVGRRSKSKKYGYDAITLNYEKNKAVASARSRMHKITLYKRESGVSAAIGDMGTSVSSFEIIALTDLTLRERLEGEGIKTRLMPYRGDLYVQDTPLARKLLAECTNSLDGAPFSYEQFTSAIDGTPWLDIPFMNDICWENVANKKVLST